MFSSARRAPRRWWRRGLGIVVALVLVVLVGWALILGALWVYSWFQLGGLDLQATDEDVVALGSLGAQAPQGATTALVVMTGPRDPTIPSEPDLVAPVAIVQDSPTREGLAVLLLPPELPVVVDELGRTSLREVHDQGGEDLLARAVIDYTEIALDHVVSVTENAIPRLLDVLGEVELCTLTGCSPVSEQQVRTAQRASDAGLYVTTLVEVLRGLGRSMDTTSVVTSPLTAKRVVDVVADEVRTDVSLRGRTLLDIAEELAQLGAVEFDEVPLLRNPRSGELVPLEEPAMVRFQRLRDGSPLEVDEDVEEELRGEVIQGIEVAVLNGAGVDGLAGQIQRRIEDEGFDVVGTGNAASFDRTTTIVAFGPEPDAVATAAVLLAERLGDEIEVQALDEPPRFEGDAIDILVTVGADLAPEEDLDE